MLVSKDKVYLSKISSDFDFVLVGCCVLSRRQSDISRVNSRLRFIYNSKIKIRTEMWQCRREDTELGRSSIIYTDRDHK